MNESTKPIFDNGSNTILNLNPIGVIHSARLSKFETPHQPNYEQEEQSVIELALDPRLSVALCDLEKFSHIWLLWWFDRNNHRWKPKVLPPRGKAKRRGVFATRSPHRPNPIGLTAVKLLQVSKNFLYVGANDLLDGTPILDIKPYLPGVDCINTASNGWLSEVEADLQNPPAYKVELSELAKAKLSWLCQREVDFIDRATEILERDPTPHRTRRIRKLSNNTFQISCASWRMTFSIHNEQILIEDVYSGYPRESLQETKSGQLLDFQVHLDFYSTWTR